MELLFGMEKEVVDLITSILHFTLFTINQTPITLISLVMFFFFLIVFSVGSHLLRKFMIEKLLGAFQIEEHLRFTFARIVHYVIMLIGAIVAFQFIGIDFSGLAVIIGLLSVGIGFGLQNITSNFISGLIVLFERPIKVGDRVTVGGTEGDVTDISIRATTIRTENNISIIVPNSEFVSSSVINWSHGDQRVRLDIDVGVSYDSDLETVMRTLRECAKDNGEVMNFPEPQVHLLSFGDSAWDMQLRLWIPDPKRHASVRSAINCAIVRKFREAKIEIPFPQRVIWEAKE